MRESKENTLRIPCLDSSEFSVLRTRLCWSGPTKSIFVAGCREWVYRPDTSYIYLFLWCLPHIGGLFYHWHSKHSLIRPPSVSLLYCPSFVCCLDGPRQTQENPHEKKKPKVVLVVAQCMRLVWTSSNNMYMSTWLTLVVPKAFLFLFLSRYNLQWHQCNYCISQGYQLWRCKWLSSLNWNPGLQVSEQEAEKVVHKAVERCSRVAHHPSSWVRQTP
jgi:hypothetical protein